jgi:hypothetical protein
VPEQPPLIPSRVVVVVLLLLAGLLVVAVGVGLLRNQIDPNGLALALIPAISGVILGAALRRSNGGTDKDEK